MFCWNRYRHLFLTLVISLSTVPQAVGMELLLGSLGPELRAKLCENLLQVEKASVALPLNASVEPILTNLLSLGTSKAHLFDPDLQAYLGQVRHAFSESSDPQLQHLARVLGRLSERPGYEIHILNESHHPRAMIRDLRAHIQNELGKLPRGLIRLLGKSGRDFWVTLGPITLMPHLMRAKDKVLRGWETSLETMPGLAGGTHWSMGTVVNGNSLYTGHSSVNMILHEVLHDVDFGRADVAGLPLFSMTPEFNRIRSETDYRAWDWYERDYFVETFAEFGANYFHSTKSREFLRDTYPQWFAYFQKLEERYRE